RRHLLAATGLCPALPLAAQRSAFPGPVRPPPADLVLRADPADRPAAGDAAGAAVWPLSGVGRVRRLPAALPSAGVHAAGRRVVRVVLLAVGLQAADLRHARLSAAGPGAGLLPGRQSLAADRLAAGRGDHDIPTPGHRSQLRTSVVR